jgi:probable rRNA maturation factor
LSEGPLEVEIVGAERLVGSPGREQIERLCVLATASAGIARGHLAIEFVDSERIRVLNREHRGLDEPTDVLSFPVDGIPDSIPVDGDPEAERDGLPLELGDVIICPAHTRDLAEAVVHGVLHLVGMDHEHDQGEMLALQNELLSWERS